MDPMDLIHAVLIEMGFKPDEKSQEHFDIQSTRVYFLENDYRFWLETVADRSGYENELMKTRGKTHLFGICDGDGDIQKNFYFKGLDYLGALTLAIDQASEWGVLSEKIRG